MMEDDQQITENNETPSSDTVHAGSQTDSLSVQKTEMDNESNTQISEPSVNLHDNQHVESDMEHLSMMASSLDDVTSTQMSADQVETVPPITGAATEHSAQVTTSQEDIADCDAIFNSASHDGINMWQLDTLPTELLMHICSFLNARDIVCTLSRVCWSFYELFSGDAYWKTRISNLCPKKYPVVARDKFNWKHACIEREEQYQRWSSPAQHMHHFVFREGLFAPVDTVHIMQNGQILASGSRDRYLTVLDLKKCEPDKPVSDADIRVHSDSKAHKGWIWSMASEDNILVTGSWDMFIKMWDMQVQCTLTQEYKCKSAVLGLHMEPHLIVAGGYDKRMYLIDPREERVRFKKFHKQPVLCVAADDNYFITGSEDKTIVVYDRRAEAVYKTIEVDEYILDMSYGDGQLWCGDKQGLVHLYDTTHGSFTHVQTCDVGHRGKLTGIVHTLGSVFTCSTDHTIKVLEPTIDPGTITTLTAHTGDVARLSYQNGILASAGSDISIGVWIPKI